MSAADIAYVAWCIENDAHKFYVWSKWLKKRRDILKADHYECQHCKARGVYTRATTVHHVCHVLKHPNLALEEYYMDNGQRRRNLISLCHDCHEAEHGYRKKPSMPLTPERW